MEKIESLLSMALDELTQYSTDARKIEQLRRKICLSVPMAQQREVKEALLTQMPSGELNKIIEEQRQTVALPFWGIAGLGLLLGISRGATHRLVGCYRWYFCCYQNSEIEKRKCKPSE
jgi:hypothetical protein